MTYMYVHVHVFYIYYYNHIFEIVDNSMSSVFHVRNETELFLSQI